MKMWSKISRQNNRSAQKKPLSRSYECWNCEEKQFVLQCPKYRTVYMSRGRWNCGKKGHKHQCHKPKRIVNQGKERLGNDQSLDSINSTIWFFVGNITDDRLMMGLDLMNQHKFQMDLENRVIKRGRDKIAVKVPNQGWVTERLCYKKITYREPQEKKTLSGRLHTVCQLWGMALLENRKQWTHIIAQTST